MYDMRDEPLVHRLLVASDKLVDVVAKKQLGNREVALATYLNELAVMLDTAKSKGGDARDVGINRLSWKAAAQAIHDRLGGYGVVDPTALDQKIDVCTTSLASSEEQAGTSGLDRPMADAHCNRRSSLNQQALTMTISWTLSAQLLQRSPIIVICFRAMMKQLKMMTDDHAENVHAAMSVRAKKVSRVS